MRTCTTFLTRRFVPLALAVALALVLPRGPVTFAQDGDDDSDTDESIAHILDASATDPDAPEFTVLLDAAEEAGLVPVLEENGPFTVFAPTDAAFQRLLTDLSIEPETLFADYEFLLRVLLYHIVPGTLDAASLTALGEVELATVLPGASIGLTTDAGVAVDAAPVVGTDIMAANGVIHIIDGVLIPAEEEGHLETLLTELPETTLADLITARAEDNDAQVRQFANLLLAAHSAELVDALATGGPFTLFAPTDAAFATFLAANGLTLADLDDNAELLTEILQYHLVPGALLAEDVLALDNAYAGTLLPGQTLHIVAITEENAEGEAVIDVTVNGAAIDLTLVDLLGENGVIHAIDAVLVPATE
jgi:transforming growth factor-beta-induced protein